MIYCSRNFRESKSAPYGEVKKYSGTFYGMRWRSFPEDGLFLRIETFSSSFYLFFFINLFFFLYYHSEEKKKTGRKVEQRTVRIWKFESEMPNLDQWLEVTCFICWQAAGFDANEGKSEDRFAFDF